ILLNLEAELKPFKGINLKWEGAQEYHGIVMFGVYLEANTRLMANLSSWRQMALKINDPQVRDAILSSLLRLDNQVRADAGTSDEHEHWNTWYNKSVEAAIEFHTEISRLRGEMTGKMSPTQSRFEQAVAVLRADAQLAGEMREQMEEY